MSFEPWQLALIDAAGYNGIREEHIEAVAREIITSGKTVITRAEPERACRAAFVDPDNFTPEALERLERRLNAELAKP